MITGRVDAQARALLLGVLKDTLALLSLCERSLVQLTAHFESQDISKAHARVVSLLSTRLADDVHVIRACCASGYTIQALTLAASVHELAFVLAYIADSDDRATVWLKWDKLNKLPWQPHEIREAVLGSAFGASASSKEQSERLIYQLVCLAKHGNPAIQRHRTAVSSSGMHLLNADPLVSPGTAKGAKAAAWVATRAIGYAILALAQKYMLPERLLKNAVSIVDKTQALECDVLGRNR